MPNTRVPDSEAFDRGFKELRTYSPAANRNSGFICRTFLLDTIGFIPMLYALNVKRKLECS